MASKFEILSIPNQPILFIAEELVSTNEIKEIFALFDKTQKGQVNTSELGTLVRALNLNPTETEITEMQAKVDKNNTGSFNVETLEKVVIDRGKD